MSAKVTLKAANDAFIIAGGTDEAETLLVQSLTGWGTLTALIEGNADPDQASTEWVALMGMDLAAGTSTAAGITAAGKVMRFDVAGFPWVRVRCSAFTSGTGIVAFGHGKGCIRA